MAAVQQAANGTIPVSPIAYALIAMLLSLAGVWLARLVTIDSENKKLGRTQTWRETLPLTLIGVLIVCPLIWHFSIAVPWATFIGLGVGYSVRVLLKVFGTGAVDAARAFTRSAADQLNSERPAAPEIERPGTGILPPDNDGPDGPARAALLDRLGEVPSAPPAAPRLPRR